MTPQALKNQAARVARRQQITDEAIRMVLAAPMGRELVWHFVDELCNVHGSPFVTSDPEGRLTARACGRQDPGRELLARCFALEPHLTGKMLDEYRQRVVSEALQRLAEAAEAVPSGGDPSAT